MYAQRKLRRVHETILPLESNKHYIFVCVCTRAVECVLICVRVYALQGASACARVSLLIQYASRLHHIVIFILSFGGKS
jgi:hypothetical protein